MNLQYFISLHEILLPVKSYILDKNDLDKKDIDNIIINYHQIKINYKFEKKKIKLFLDHVDMDSTHIFRLLRSKKIINDDDSIDLSENLCTEYLMSINELLLSTDNKNFCTICANELNVKGLKKISHCDNDNCKQQYYSIVTDNRIMDLYNQDPRVFMFLLNVFVSGLTHPKVDQTFKPFPFIPNVNNIVELKKIIPQELQIQNHIKLMDKFNLSSNDIELYKKLEPNTYCIIKNAISNNYFSMSSRENVIIDSSVIFIHINYSAEIENKFLQNHYLFHGSSIYSWYPIIKNGLKVMSGTALQANGAVYGNGIYFSDSFQFSLGYSQNRGSSDTCVVGVFEILEDPVKYKKAPNIFVIADDTILLLRSLVITKPHSKISGDITNYFIKELPLQKKINKISVTVLKNKRLDSEYKKLLNDIFIKDVTNIKIIDQTKWEIEFLKIKNKTVKVELIFSNYPMSPPIIKMLSNIKIDGFVKHDGVVSIDLINPANWKLTNNLTEICLSLYNCFSESI
jgi:ubiquitin-protein ligase